MDNNELYHYGVKGMRWGHRMARGHAGPGRYVTKKRQLAGDKRDLETLNNGGHLSKGFTKKRQAAFDRRDKAALEKRIVKNEKDLSQNKESKGLTDKQKTALKVGVAVAGTTLAAYGTYKLNNFVKDRHVEIELAKAITRSKQQAATLGVKEYDSARKRGLTFEQARIAYNRAYNNSTELFNNEYKSILEKSLRSDSFGKAAKNVLKTYMK